jgi:transcriptional regulator
VGDAPEEFTRAMLAGIVGFEMTVSSLVGKMKLSQNRTEGDRDAVHQALQASADAEAREMAKMFSM